METKLNPLVDCDKRLTVLESAFNTLKPFMQQSLMGKAPKNPMDESEWEYLLNRLVNNSLTQEEAIKLRSAFQEREEKAKQENDLMTLLALGLGLAFLAIILNKNK